MITLLQTLIKLQVVVGLMFLQTHCLSVTRSFHDAIDKLVPCWTVQDAAATLDHCVRRDHRMFDVCDLCTNLNNILSSPQVEPATSVPSNFPLRRFFRIR